MRPAIRAILVRVAVLNLYEATSKLQSLNWSAAPCLTTTKRLRLPELRIGTPLLRGNCGYLLGSPLQRGSIAAGLREASKTQQHSLARAFPLPIHGCPPDEDILF
jgi:hypothetical protein